MGCGKKKVKGKGGDQALLCNRDVVVCGSIDLPQGFRLSDQGDLEVGINACLDCRTDEISVECDTDGIDHCGPLFLTASAIRAVGCFNYVISVPVESSCPETVSTVSLQNSVCVDQVVCIQDCTFECDQEAADCDVHFIFVGVTQVTPEGCGHPSRLEVYAIFRLFDSVCPSPVYYSENSPKHSDYDRVLAKD